MNKDIPKKVLRKRIKTQAKSVADLQEENERLTKENNRNADMVQWIYPLTKELTIGLVLRDHFADVLERAGIKVDSE